MGVRGLLGSIRPYSTRTVWEKHQFTTGGLVIDGPALAYYIYYHCLACQRNARNALFAVPSYVLLCQATLAFLDKLESRGLRVKYIFFDGALPKSKFETRLERMQKSVNEMRGFKNLNPTPLEYPKQGTEVPLEDVWSSISGQAVYVNDHLKRIHAAPFIVPATIEYLRDSKYAGVTEIVPGEADLFCTSATSCNSNDVILTSDSDFLLQNPAAQICILSDLEFTDTSITLRLYDCQDIARRLKVSEDQMALVGYYMQLDPYIGLVECADRARRNSLENDHGYLEFRKQYHPWGTESKWEDIAKSWGICKEHEYIVDLTLLIQSLDPRIAETIIDAGHENQIRLFLPAMFEDPARSSAWSQSAYIRYIAYSIVTQSFSDKDSNFVNLLEFDRAGISVKSKDQKITIEGEIQWGQKLKKLSNRIEHLLHIFREHQAHHAWAIVTLLLFLDEGSNESTLPNRKDVAKLICGATPAETKTLSWSRIHLNAQLEACFYSLRILKQIASLAAVIVPDDEQLSKVKELFQTMPPLHQILRTPFLGMDLDGSNDKIDVEIETFYPNFNASKDAQDEPPKNKNKRKKRSITNVAAQKLSNKGISDSKNRFELLRDGI